MGRTRTREFKESKIWGGIKDSRRLEGGGEESPGGVLDITCTTLSEKNSLYGYILEIQNILVFLHMYLIRRIMKENKLTFLTWVQGCRGSSLL